MQVWIAPAETQDWQELTEDTHYVVLDAAGIIYLLDPVWPIISQWPKANIKIKSRWLERIAWTSAELFKSYVRGVGVLDTLGIGLASNSDTTVVSVGSRWWYDPETKTWSVPDPIWLPDNGRQCFNADDLSASLPETGFFTGCTYSFGTTDGYCATPVHPLAYSGALARLPKETVIVCAQTEITAPPYMRRNLYHLYYDEPTQNTLLEITSEPLMVDPCLSFMGQKVGSTVFDVSLGSIKMPGELAEGLTRVLDTTAVVQHMLAIRNVPYHSLGVFFAAYEAADDVFTQQDTQCLNIGLAMAKAYTANNYVGVVVGPGYWRNYGGLAFSSAFIWGATVIQFQVPDEFLRSPRLCYQNLPPMTV